MNTDYKHDEPQSRRELKIFVIKIEGKKKEYLFLWLESVALVVIITAIGITKINNNRYNNNNNSNNYLKPQLLCNSFLLLP